MPQRKTSKASPEGEHDGQPARPQKRAKKQEQKTERPAWYIIKEDPADFSIQDLQRDQTTCWDGVRQPYSRNIMKSMKVGDKIFYYHSDVHEPGIVGIAEVVKEAYPDFTAWDPKSKYHDPKSSEENPKWFMVDIKFDRMTRRLIPLHELKQYKEAELEDMALFSKGRLAIQRMEQRHVDFILQLEEREPAGEEVGQ